MRQLKHLAPSIGMGAKLLFIPPRRLSLIRSPAYQNAFVGLGRYFRALSTRELDPGKFKMAFWRGETLLSRLPSLIEPFDTGAIDCAAYTLHVGSEVYVSPDRQIPQPSRHTKQTLKSSEGFTIPPGQFAFLMTDEHVSIPDTAIAFISIKARLKFSGLVNISGFHVDPGYTGKLLFSVLNAGPKSLHLQQGQALFLIWYADPDGPTTYKKHEPGFSTIEPALVNGISGEIQSLQSLSEEYRSLEQRVERTLHDFGTTVSGQRIRLNLFLVLTTGLTVGAVLIGLRSLF